MGGVTASRFHFRPTWQGGTFPPLHPPRERRDNARTFPRFKDIERRMNNEADDTKPKKKRSEKRQRDLVAKMRCTPEEKADIVERANRAGLTESGYLRACVFGKDTKQPNAAHRPPIEKTLLSLLRGDLGKVGGNLNQIAKAINSGLPHDPRELSETVQDIREVVAAIRAALGVGEKARKRKAAPESGVLLKKLFRDNQG